MSTMIAAAIATLIVTGMTSAVSHDITILGGSAGAVLLACSTLLRTSVSVYPAFLFGSVAMSVIALVSSEANTAPFDSTIHVLSCYIALAGLAFASPDMSGFCQQVMMGTNLLLTAWVLYQGFAIEQLRAWQISNPSGLGNLMAAEINMTLPLVLTRIHHSRGSSRLAYVVLICLNCFAVVLVMSRNGIGAMLIILTIYILFNHKRLAVLVSSAILGIILSVDSIIQIPFVHNVLVKLRIVEFNPVAPRSLIWRVAWEHIRANPMLGVGPGEPKKALAVIDIYHAHNNFVQVALETGIPTAVIFSVLVILLLWLCGTTVLRSREYFVPTLPILAYLSYSWTGGPLTFPGATLLLSVCVHEARVAIRRQNEEARQLRMPERGAVIRPVSRAA